MTVRRDSGHPDLDSLAEHLDGGLAPAESERLEAHLSSCARCRIELARLRRFRSIDEDAELLDEAAWPAAERALEEAFAERILPVAAGRRESRFRRFAGFLVPIAAAAAVLVVFAAIESPLPPAGGDVGRGPVRGVAAGTVELLWPVGDVEEAPVFFEWAPAADADRYELRVFDPDLETVFRAEEIAGTTVAVPDSTAARFEPGEIYLWSVDAFTGLERSASSANGWFRIRVP